MDVRTWLSRQLASHQRKDREEAARIRAMTTEQRSQIFSSLCASAMRAVFGLSEEERKRALEYRDPMPESSRQAWSRLQKAYAPSTARR